MPSEQVGGSFLMCLTVQSLPSSSVCTFFKMSLFASYLVYHGMETRTIPFSLTRTCHLFEDFFVLLIHCLWTDSSAPAKTTSILNRAAGKHQGFCRLIIKVTLVISLLWSAKLYCLGKGGGVRQIQTLLFSVFLRHILPPALEKEVNGQRKNSLSLISVDL